MPDTTQLTVAEELRKAAGVLRETAVAAIAGPWESLDGGDRLVAWRTAPGSKFDDDFEYVVDEPIDGATAEWMALVGPDLAEPLAELLDGMAESVDQFGSDGRGPRLALAVARVLIGGSRG